MSQYRQEDDFDNPAQYEAYLLTLAFEKLRPGIDPGEAFNTLCSYFYSVELAPDIHTPEEWLTMIEEIIATQAPINDYSH